MKYSTLSLVAGHIIYVALGIDAVCDIEKAHPAFDTKTGNSLDPAYLDGRHFAAAGKTAAANALAAILKAL